jgi:hypothetical protein
MLEALGLGGSPKSGDSSMFEALGLSPRTTGAEEMGEELGDWAELAAQKKRQLAEEQAKRAAEEAEQAARLKLEQEQQAAVLRQDEEKRAVLEKEEQEREALLSESPDKMCGMNIVLKNITRDQWFTGECSA